MRQHIIVFIASIVLFGGGVCFLSAQETSGKDSVSAKKGNAPHELSFAKDVQPLINKKCMSCHYPENEFNSSHLVLGSYEGMMKGGKHGPPIVPGNAKKSLLYQKLLPQPPFGDQMPDVKDNKLSAADLRLISDWINQGAKK